MDTNIHEQIICTLLINVDCMLNVYRLTTSEFMEAAYCLFTNVFFCPKFNWLMKFPIFRIHNCTIALLCTTDRNAFINNVEYDINETNSLKHLLNNTYYYAII